MSKVHYYSSLTLELAPKHIKDQYSLEGLSGTICGYVRKEITTEKSKVTCKLCLRELNKR